MSQQGQAQTTPSILNLPVGTGANGMRSETDSMGAVDVPAERYWGAQTQRSRVHFAIGDDRMPIEVCRAYGYVKKAAAQVNGELGEMPAWKAELIARVCDEVISGALDGEFPLSVWQTGSGTQTNMNVNEVISNRAIQLSGEKLGSKAPVHPNNDVNMSQSSNDTFPTAMHVATVIAFDKDLIPAVQMLREAIYAKAREWVDVVKIGRTHLQDATPLTVGQEWSGYAAQLDDALLLIRGSMQGLCRLANRSECAGRIRRQGRREAGGVPAFSLCVRAEQVCFAGIGGRDGDSQLCATFAGSCAYKNCERLAVAGVGTAGRVG